MKKAEGLNDISLISNRPWSLSIAKKTNPQKANILSVYVTHTTCQACELRPESWIVSVSKIVCQQNVNTSHLLKMCSYIIYQMSHFINAIMTSEFAQAKAANYFLASFYPFIVFSA